MDQPRDQVVKETGPLIAKEKNGTVFPAVSRKGTGLKELSNSCKRTRDIPREIAETLPRKTHLGCTTDRRGLGICGSRHNRPLGHGNILHLRIYLHLRPKIA